MKDYIHFSSTHLTHARCGKAKTGYMKWTENKGKVQCPICTRLYLQDEAELESIRAQHEEAERAGRMKAKYWYFRLIGLMFAARRGKKAFFFKLMKPRSKRLFPGMKRIRWR